MLDKLTERIMASFHKNARESITPVVNVMKKNVNAQMDIGGKLLKLGTTILVFIGLIRMSGRENIENPRRENPGTIIINNYIQDRHMNDPQ